MLAEGVVHFEIGVGSVIADAFGLIGPDGDIAIDGSTAFQVGLKPVFERFELELAGAPSCFGGRQEVAVFAEPEIKIMVGIKTQNRLAEKTFEPPQKIIDLRQLLAGIGKKILEIEIGIGLAHKHG